MASSSDKTPRQPRTGPAPHFLALTIALAIVVALCWLGAALLPHVVAEQPAEAVILLRLTNSCAVLRWALLPLAVLAGGLAYLFHAAAPTPRR